MQYLRAIKVRKPKMYLFSLTLAFLLPYFVKSGLFSASQKGSYTPYFPDMFGRKTLDILRIVFSLKLFVGI